jgi:hypothetical protein
LSVRTLQRLLTVAWLAVALLELFFLASAMERLGERFGEIVGWYSQTTVPTLTLLLATFFATPVEQQQRPASPLTATIAILSCVGYLGFAAAALWTASGQAVAAILPTLSKWSLLLAVAQVPLDATLVFIAVRRPQ